MIPAKFSLLGHTIKVKKSKRLIQTESVHGLWDPLQLTITIDTTQPMSHQVHTFWHEVIHAALDLTGNERLSRDERLVDALGGALAQIISSMR